MSPIRASQKARYPRDWPVISRRIRADRAGWRCECDGRCGTGHTGRCPARQHLRHPVTRSLVVLTVAHLDHTPEHCADANLAAMCQHCHLAYDRDHHTTTRTHTDAEQHAPQMDPLFTLNPQENHP